MSEINEAERRNKMSQDYYAGYYWGSNPFDSCELPGRNSDNDLKIAIVERLKARNSIISTDYVEISVNNGTVILAGRVKTYRERRLIGQEVWNTHGVIKVLNDLQVTEPETAGPSKKID
jgi:osmotically-inducible protein OsmY